MLITVLTLASGASPHSLDTVSSQLLCCPAVLSVMVPRGFREAMEYISGRIADKATASPANTLAPKPGGSSLAFCFLFFCPPHWSNSVKQSYSAEVSC